MRPVLKNCLIGSVFTAAIGLAPAAMAGDQLEIRDFVGTINWSNGPLKVEVQKNKGETHISGRKAITIDGRQAEIDGKECQSSYGSYSFDWFGRKKEGRVGGYENLKDFPILEITLPDDTELVIRNSIVFSDGAPNLAEANIELRYCGDLTLGDVDGTLAFDSRGSADLNIGKTGQMAVSLRGSGDLTGGNSGDVLIESRGSGDIELGNIMSLDADMRGSGDIELGDVGGDVTLSSFGSGDAEFESVSGSFYYTGNGSGNLDVESVKGVEAKLESSGSGDIDINSGNIDGLIMTAKGSATLEFGGTAQTATLKATGSGDIYVDRVTGEVDMRTSGSGDIDIGDRS